MEDERAADEHRDELPAALDVTGLVGPYTFPDNNRRRIAGALYLGAAVLCVWLRAARHHNGVLVYGGFLVVGVAFAAVGLYHWAAGYHLATTETDALVAATRQVGFPVGHASAQLGWRGLRSRPTWRILLYSADDPPTRRGLVLVDGVDSGIVAFFVEDNPEDWSKLSR